VREKKEREGERGGDGGRERSDIFFTTTCKKSILLEI
jgi:hypothetical protein